MTGGRLRGLAVTGEKRLAALPQVPSFAEAGMPGYDQRTWQAILAPAATPREIVHKLSAEIARVLALPDIRDKLTSQGMDPRISTPEQFAALIKADTERYAKVIETANIKLME